MKEKASWGAAFATAFIVAVVNAIIFFCIDKSSSVEHTWQEIGLLIISAGAFMFLVYLMREILSRRSEGED